MKVLFLLSFTVLSFFIIDSPISKYLGSVKSPPPHSDTIEKTKAFEILKNKCNVCHVKKNRKKVFTLNNMDLFSSKIHTQVFVKKRMPKGKKITLTNSDIITLKNWLKTLNIRI